MQQGWISLHRKIRASWVWQEKPFSKGHAWIDLILSANHKDNKIVLGSQLVLVEKGSFITSELKLMDRWGWSKTKVRNFLNLLQNDGMIIKNSDRKKTTISICNYGLYQDVKTTEKPQKNQSETIEEPLEDTNNNVNHANNDYIIMTSEQEQFICALKTINNYPLDITKDIEYFSTLEQRYPQLDLVEAAKDFATYKLDNPFKINDNPRSQLNTSCRNYVKWGKCLKQPEPIEKPKQPTNDISNEDIAKILQKRREKNDAIQC